MFLQLLVLLCMVCVSHTQTMYHKIGVRLCQLKCVERSYCESVAYDNKTMTCQLLKKVTERQVKKGYMTFQRRKDIPFTGACSLKACVSNTRCLETHQGRVVCVQDYDDLAVTVKASTDSPGKPANILYKGCRGNQDCSSSNLKCFEGICKCPMGLSFNPANNTCVRGCKEYGNEFTGYKGFKTSEVSGVMMGVSVSECSQECFQMTEFTCLSFVHWSFLDMCQTYRRGWLELPPYSRERANRQWKFATRNCA